MEHKKELNRVWFWHIQPDEDRDERLVQLRNRYADNSPALQEIDLYDSSSGFASKIELYLEAIANGDVGEQANLREWFQEHYPDVNTDKMP